MEGPGVWQTLGGEKKKRGGGEETRLESGKLWERKMYDGEEA